jgi:hypothetical protein
VSILPLGERYGGGGEVELLRLMSLATMALAPGAAWDDSSLLERGRGLRRKALAWARVMPLEPTEELSLEDRSEERWDIQMRKREEMLPEQDPLWGDFGGRRRGNRSISDQREGVASVEKVGETGHRA